MDKAKVKEIKKRAEEGYRTLIGSGTCIEEACNYLDIASLCDDYLKAISRDDLEALQDKAIDDLNRLEDSIEKVEELKNISPSNLPLAIDQAVSSLQLDLNELEDLLL